MAIGDENEACDAQESCYSRLRATWRRTQAASQPWRADRHACRCLCCWSSRCRWYLQRAGCICRGDATTLTGQLLPAPRCVEHQKASVNVSLRGSLTYICVGCRCMMFACIIGRLGMSRRSASDDQSKQARVGEQGHCLVDTCSCPHIAISS